MRKIVLFWLLCCAVAEVVVPATKRKIHPQRSAAFDLIFIGPEEEAKSSSQVALGAKATWPHSEDHLDGELDFATLGKRRGDETKVPDSTVVFGTA